MNNNRISPPTEPDEPEATAMERRTLAYRLRLPALSYARQKTLLKELEEALQKFPDMAEYIRQLLITLWGRPDTRPIIKRRIEDLLGSVNVPTFTLRVGKTWDSYKPIFATFSPNSELILASSYIEPPELWDVKTGEKIRELAQHGAPCVFSPDGRYLLAEGENNTAFLWDIESDQVIRSFIGHNYQVLDMALSPDGKYALTCCGGGVNEPARLWDVATGQELHQFFANDHDGIFAVAFSADGGRIFTGFLTSAKLWDTITGQEVREFTGYRGGVSKVAFSSNGKYLLMVSYMTAYLWDLTTGQEIQRFPHEETCGGITFSPDNRYVFTSSDRKASLWDINTGEEHKTFMWFSDSISSLALSADGQFALAGSHDGTVKVWRL